MKKESDDKNEDDDKNLKQIKEQNSLMNSEIEILKKQMFVSF